MKRIFIVLFILLLNFPICANAKEYEETPLMYKMRATAYCLNGNTSTGSHVREGICASGKPELIGKTLILYQRLPNNKRGKFIGVYEVLDSGCDKNVIDVWQPKDKCQDFMNCVYEDECHGKVWVQIVDAKG